MNTNRTQFGHIPALDGLRGIAILVVMIYHFEYVFPEIHAVVKGGFLGVDIFFVLSGFLITSVLIKEQEKHGSIDLVNFYLRRFLRLIPAFWVFLFVLYFGANYLLPRDGAREVLDNNNFLYAFLYLMNWHRAAMDIGIAGNLNHTWSLAIEEQFYIFWSLVLFLAFKEKRGKTQILSITIGLIFLVMVWRLVRAATGTSLEMLYYSTDTRIDALMVGCAAGMINYWRLIPERFLRSRTFDRLAFGCLLLAATIFIFVSHNSIAIYFGLFTLFSILIGIGILWITSRPSEHRFLFLTSTSLVWIGRISYALYLWHYVCYEFAKKLFVSQYIQGLFGVSMAFLIAIASYFLIEKPFLKLKDRLNSENLSNFWQLLPFQAKRDENV